MKHSLVRVARAGLKMVSVVVDPFLGPFHGPRILIYHQVGVDLGREMEVSTEAFSRQLDWMQRHGEIVDLETAILRRMETDADRLFVLTFDDGFEDVFINAFPLMRHRGIPFTLYLTTQPIETGESIDPKFPDARPLAWDQVNEMIATGLVTVGAHTHTHPNLRLVAEDRIDLELGTADDLILLRTGITPRHFTYPWGSWSDRADRFVRDRYESATVGSSPINGSDDTFRLTRLPVQRSDMPVFFRRRMRRGLRVESRVREVRDGSRRH